MYDLTAQDCDAGYYCSGSSGSATQNRCEFNEKCETGTLYPEQCLFNEYTASITTDTCLACDAGKTCPGGTTYDCEGGKYCIDNTETYCPPGKYGTYNSATTISKTG